MHRDPETGQFMTHDDEPVELNYSDHEILNFRISGLNGSGETAPRDAESVTYQIDQDVLDLENDELAMLSWLDTSISVFFAPFPEDGGNVTRGGVHLTAEIGANLAGSEYLAKADPDFGIQEIDVEPEVNSFALNAADEPGTWAHLNVSATSGYKDTDPDGTFSGQGAGDNDRMRRVFSEETSGGPYIDATDDISIGIYSNRNGTAGDFLFTVYGQMSFVVFEYEDRRAEFAPYDPGGMR